MSIKKCVRPTCSTNSLIDVDSLQGGTCSSQHSALMNVPRRRFLQNNKCYNWSSETTGVYSLHVVMTGSPTAHDPPPPVPNMELAAAITLVLTQICLFTNDLCSFVFEHTPSPFCDRQQTTTTHGAPSSARAPLRAQRHLMNGGGRCALLSYSVNHARGGSVGFHYSLNLRMCGCNIEPVARSQISSEGKTLGSRSLTPSRSTGLTRHRSLIDTCNLDTNLHLAVDFSSGLNFSGYCHL